MACTGFREPRTDSCVLINGMSPLHGQLIPAHSDVPTYCHRWCHLPPRFTFGVLSVPFIRHESCVIIHWTHLAQILRYPQRRQNPFNCTEVDIQFNTQFSERADELIETIFISLSWPQRGLLQTSPLLKYTLIHCLVSVNVQQALMNEC